ncbi:MAG: HEAT repeat domain-containing protein [Planctomycetota bacterium]
MRIVSLASIAFVVLGVFVAAMRAGEHSISVELGFRKKPPTFAVNESIVVEARFVNRTNNPQIYRGGLGDKNIKSSCQIKLMAEGGKAWSAEAVAAPPCANHKDIEVPAHGQTLIGQWDLSKLVYSEGSGWRAGGKIPFAEIARPSQYRIRWWDGVFQAGTPLRSDPVDFQIAPGLKPRDLCISGTNVFSAPERTHEIMKNVFVVLQFSDHKDMSDVVVETTFTEGQGIKWCPLRSARPPEYEFRGHWQLNENGELSITGRYVPVHGTTELPPRLRAEKELRFRIVEGFLRPGTPPYAHTVELWITQTKPSEPSNLSVRQRLQRAIDVSRALAAKGQQVDDASVRSLALEACEPSDRKTPLLFPRTEDVEAYTQARPWASHYTPNSALLRPMRQNLDKIEHWPPQTDAPELRKLLEDKDPAIRCVAAESLATLHQPEDVGRIGRLLKDDADGLPGLGGNHTRSARYIGGEEIVANGLHHMRSWHNRTVADTARLALRLMTGVELTAKDFDPWWRRNRGGRTCVWYWQQRLIRELAAADALAAAAWQEDEPKDLKSYEAKRNRILAQKQQRFDAVRQAVAGELAQLPAEIEAKVRLAAMNRYSTSLGVGLDEPLLGPFICHRIGTDRLLELLERKDLWEDVEWKNPYNYNNLVVQVVGRAELFFTPEHLPRLRAIMDREHGGVWWSGQTAFVVGISHLLSPAEATNLDEPKTRDGWLRSRMRTEGDLFVRGAVAQELIRVGLPENGEFLKKEFFAETGRKSGFPDLRQAMLQALGQSPLTPPKRTALVDIVLDERFVPLWTQPNHRMGDDMYRQYAMQAVNAHAGKALLTDQDKYALTDPAKSEKALAEVCRKVATLRQTKNPEEPIPEKKEGKP